MYSKKIMEEFLEPKNYGVIRGASACGKVSSDIGSEIIKIYIRVEGDKIAEAQFQTFGGVVAIALTSFATELIIGKSLAEAEKVVPSDLVKIAGNIPEEKSYVANLVVSAIRKAVANYNKHSKVED